MIKIILLIIFSGLMYNLIKNKNYQIKDRKRINTNQWEINLKPRKEYEKIFNENRKNKNYQKKEKYKKWLIILSLLASSISIIAYNKTINNNKTIYKEINKIKKFFNNIEKNKKTLQVRGK